MKNYHNSIKQAIKTHEWVCFGDVINRLGIKSESIKQSYYRAWQDLKINGTLQIGNSGLFRVNQ